MGKIFYISIYLKCVSTELPYLELFQWELYKKKYTKLHKGAAKAVDQLLGKYLA